ncbi:MAG: LytTR family transcriptional regulator, partial [Bacteroidetes bacterium]|nr:LytTR family transcriptional regulator [Bacteroidota bacterium]
NGKKILLSKTLGWIVPELPQATFVRVSRCHAVNLHYLDGIENKDEQYFALVSDGSQLQISRRRLKQVSDYC